MSQTWNYNNQEFEVDLQDVDFAEKYERAFNQLDESEKKMQKEGSLSGVLRGYCLLFHNLFDDIYGQGTAKKMFGDKVNAAICNEAYAAFMDAAKRSSLEANQTRTRMMNKYKPVQNRSQRRSGAKK